MGKPLKKIDIITHLKRKLAEKGGSASLLKVEAHLYLQTGVSALDQLLGGGLTRGKVTALKGEPGSGLASLLRPCVEESLKKGHRVALIDSTGTLYAPDWFTHHGQAWVVRSEELSDALWAAELMAESGAFALVVLSTPPSKSRLYSGWTTRLRQAAQKGGSALVILGDIPPHLLSANWGFRITPIGLNPSTGQWSVRVQRTRGGEPAYEEVSFDAQARLHTCRMPTSTLVSDRRAAARRISTEKETQRALQRPRGTRSADFGRSCSKGARVESGDATTSSSLPSNSPSTSALGRAR